MGIPRKPSTAETTRNGKNNPLPTPTDFDLYDRKTSNFSKPLIIKQEEDKQPTTTDYEIIQ